MPKIFFDCNKCSEAHERPINSKCLKVSGTVSDNPHSSDGGGDIDTNLLILQELKSFSGRMAIMEQKVNSQKDETASSSNTSSVTSTPQKDDDLILPSISKLKQCKEIQAEVDARIRQLQSCNEQGKFKSQRGALIISM